MSSFSDCVYPIKLVLKNSKKNLVKSPIAIVASFQIMSRFKLIDAMDISQILTIHHRFFWNIRWKGIMEILWNLFLLQNQMKIHLRNFKVTTRAIFWMIKILLGVIRYIVCDRLKVLNILPVNKNLRHLSIEIVNRFQWNRWLKKLN